MPLADQPKAVLPQPRLGWVGYVAAIAGVGVAAILALLLERLAPASSLALVFVLPVVIAAVAFGLLPALMAAALSVLAFNFLLIEPRYTFRVQDSSNLWALALFAAVGGIVSAVAGDARRRAVESRESADRAAALQELARALVAAHDRPAILKAAVSALARFFKAPAVILIDQGDGLYLAAAEGVEELGPADLEAGAWSLAARLPTRGGAYPSDAAAFDFWPVRPRSPVAPPVLLGVALDGGGSRPSAPEQVVEAIGGYLALALERETYARQALETGVRTQGEQLKADLLAAVSHDLRTPLSTIIFTLQSLRKFDADHAPADRKGLLALAEAEASRLSGLVANLLNMSRLDADAVSVKPEASSLADLAASAIDRARAALASHPVEVRVEAAARPVWIDYGLAETALANVLENAGKYSPPGSPVLLRGHVGEGEAVVEVLDEGPGFPRGSARLFEKFTRGAEGDGRPPGTGLGLAIARGFLAAQGGGIEIVPRPDGKDGGLVRMTLPLAQNLEP